MNHLELFAQLIYESLIRKALLRHKALLHSVQPLEELLLGGQTHAAILELPEGGPQLSVPGLPRVLIVLVHLANEKSVLRVVTNMKRLLK